MQLVDEQLNPCHSKILENMQFQLMMFTSQVRHIHQFEMINDFNLTPVSDNNGITEEITGSSADKDY